MLEIQRATKTKSKATILLNGPSGSGKTYSALLMAKGMAEQCGGKVGVIDTENNAASDYCDLFDFDVINLEPPYTIDRYMKAFDLFVGAEYGVIVVDSLSHAWMGEGGVLDQVSDRQESDKNKFAAWNGPSQRYRELFDRMILRTPVHLIATSRAKQGYRLGEDNKPIKVGMQHELRDGAEYDFRLSLMLGMDHFASAKGTGKDRTGTFDEDHQITPADGFAILDWFGTGATVPPSIEATRAAMMSAMKERGWPSQVVINLINSLGGSTRLETLPASRRPDLIEATAGHYPATNGAQNEVQTK